MKKLQLFCSLGLGDIVVLTALIRELKQQYPHDYDVLPVVNTAYNCIFANNPYIPKIGPNTKEQYPEIINCNDMAAGFYSFYSHKKHFVRYAIDWLSKRLNIPLVCKDAKGSIYLTEEEQNSPSPRYKLKKPYWIIVAGGKMDATVKFYPHWQQVADGLKELNLYQVGDYRDYHPRLDGVEFIRTRSTRDFARAIYHSEGVIAPVTAAIHIAGCWDKKAVVLAGGYEPAGWIQYKNQIVINNFTCCEGLACFKKWAEKTNHGKPHQECMLKTKVNEMMFGECMNKLAPERIIDAVKSLAAVPH